ncbi:MAG: PEP/pyruvate-binding domain-containing protein [Desulfoprunum sp.]|nr:PEP/pyruvate-binding domain-containing protein [Desulfoprunum sp.]
MNILSRLIDSFSARSQIREHEALEELKARYHAFRIFLENNGRALELLVSIDGLLNRGEETAIRTATEELLSVTAELVDGLNLLSGDAHAGLYALHGQLAADVVQHLDILSDNPGQQAYCIALDDLGPGAHLLAGTKAANLARLRRMALPVPNGFVCTTMACKHFIGEGQLAAGIRRILREYEYQHQDVNQAAVHIEELILATPLPPDIALALEEAYRHLAMSEKQTGATNGPLMAISVRSSGVSEDGADHSFAGQFTSILNVIGLQSLFDAYRVVVASGFSPRAISYRLNAGLTPVDFDFAVLCQVMAKADCAGVLFTRDPSQPENGRMLISAVPGLGTMAVEGSAAVDLYRPRRAERVDDASPECLPGLFEGKQNISQARAAELLDGAEISRKTLREVPSPEGGLQQEQLPAAEADLPLLSVEILEQLMCFGEMIENLEGVGQDVEWAYARESGVAILQARPLRLAAGKGRRLRLPAAAEPLVSGACAAAGRAVGRVHIIHSTADLQQFSKPRAGALSSAPCILVLPQSIVDAAPLLKNCAGVVIEVGNPTDHLSCIAREYGVPMITGAQAALSRLHDGQWVIIDADQGMVVDAPKSIRAAVAQAHSEQVQRKAQSQTDHSPPTSLRHTVIPPERQALRQMIVPLNLTDAYGPSFSRMDCRSIHDIIRYTHEMAVLSMFDAGDTIMEDAGDLLRPLDIGVPFSFLVIDVGGGTRRVEKTSFRKKLSLQNPLSREDVLSIPLAALCDGLTTPGLNWHSGPDIDALPGIFSRSLLDTRTTRPAGSFNYALAARDYLNLNARVEFHFAMLDAVCGRDSHANYIRFRFKGGGAGSERGHRRAIFLKHVLEGNGFYTTVAGDLVTASLTGAGKEVISERLVMLGRLLGFSRFLDGVMTTDETPVQLAQAFLAGRFDTRVTRESTEEQEMQETINRFQA